MSTDETTLSFHLICGTGFGAHYCFAMLFSIGLSFIDHVAHIAKHYTALLNNAIGDVSIVNRIQRPFRCNVQ